MKKIISILLAIVFVALSTIALFAQTQQESFSHRKLGLGIRAAGLQIGDIQSNAYPTTRLTINVDPTKYFRVEGQFGVYNKTSEQSIKSGSTQVNVKQTTKSTFYGVGLMGMYPFERTRLVGGLRYGVNNYSSNQEGSSTSMNNSGKMNMYSGVIGGEYFFAQGFSIGAEFSISSTKDDYSLPNSSYSNGTTYKTTLTESNLVFRFYPF